MPTHLNRTEYPFWVRHHDGDATVPGRQRGHAKRRTVRVERVLLGDLVFVVDVAGDNEAGVAAGFGGSSVLEFGVTFAVGDGDWNNRTFHTGKKHARTLLDLE